VRRTTALLFVLRNSQVTVPDDICTAQGVPVGSTVAQFYQQMKNPKSKVMPVQEVRLVIPKAQRVSKKRVKAEAFLRERLAAGPVERDTVVADARSARIARSTLEQVSRGMALVKLPNTFGGRWMWSLSPVSPVSPV
jgi:hypothetical protein